MVTQRNLLSRTTAILGLFGLLLLLPGCPLSPDSDDGGNDDDTRLPERNTIEGTLGRLAKVWELKNYAEYELLLHEGYEFFVRDDDADDFPWAPNGSWGRTDELGFASNMFDASFSGENPPVESIDWAYDVLQERDTVDSQGNPVTEVTTDAVIQVLTGPNDGWRSDTRFVFDIVADPQFPGLFQVKRQQEVKKL